MIAISVFGNTGVCRLHYGSIMESRGKGMDFARLGKCPRCDAEMQEGRKGAILPSCLPRKGIYCPNCGYEDSVPVYNNADDWLRKVQGK